MQRSKQGARDALSLYARASRSYWPKRSLLENASSGKDEKRALLRAGSGGALGRFAPGAGRAHPALHILRAPDTAVRVEVLQAALRAEQAARVLRDVLRLRAAPRRLERRGVEAQHEWRQR